MIHLKYHLKNIKRAWTTILGNLKHQFIRKEKKGTVFWKLDDNIPFNPNPGHKSVFAACREHDRDRCCANRLIRLDCNNTEKGAFLSSIKGEIRIIIFQDF